MKKRFKFASVARHALKVWRADKQMTAAALAKAVGCSLSIINQYQHGTVKPGVERRFKLQELTGGVVRAQDWDVPHDPR
jgi:transcriptional regulator with XRE-family HTH domain